MNPQLAGRPSSHRPHAEGEWFNVGGDKLWPAPQGWETIEQWPGPPDAVLDGQPYILENLRSSGGETAIRLTSGKDPRSGIQFSRVVRIFKEQHARQLRGYNEERGHPAAPLGHLGAHAARRCEGRWLEFQSAHASVVPDQSKEPVSGGISVIFGKLDNPSFQRDTQRGLMRAQYQYKVGKIGLDSHAGWVATVDGESGAAFVQRFVFEPDKEYPDGSSVEFWHNGVGQIHAYNRDIVMVEEPLKILTCLRVKC